MNDTGINDTGINDTEQARDRDRAELPGPMRQDVRLLGEILGEVIRDSAGPELLADVERLRHAVIAARQQGRDSGTGDEIAALVGSWSLEAAEQVARAFTVYFHLANLAEEHQRIRILRERDSGAEPVRESLAAAVAELGHDAGPEYLTGLLASLRVHLVLTAHPTEARRRAVVGALRRISAQARPTRVRSSMPIRARAWRSPSSMPTRVCGARIPGPPWRRPAISCTRGRPARMSATW